MAQLWESLASPELRNRNGQALVPLLLIQFLACEECGIMLLPWWVLKAKRLEADDSLLPSGQVLPRRESQAWCAAPWQGQHSRKSTDLEPARPATS